MLVIQNCLTCYLLSKQETVQSLPHAVDRLLLALSLNVVSDYTVGLNLLYDVVKTGRLLMILVAKYCLHFLEWEGMAEQAEHFTNVFLKGSDCELFADGVKELSVLVYDLDNVVYHLLKFEHVDIACDQTLFNRDWIVTFLICST